MEENLGFKGEEMKFSLIVNESERDGFKLSVQTSSEKELQIAKELTSKLIEKIKSIEVKVKNYEDE